jgi:hypothetical protein
MVTFGSTRLCDITHQARDPDQELH